MYPDGERTPMPHPVIVGDADPVILPRRISSNWMPSSRAGSSRELVLLTVASLDRRSPAGDATVKRVA